MCRICIAIKSFDYKAYQVAALILLQEEFETFDSNIPVFVEGMCGPWTQRFE